jgi:serine phosphatase RsbU (regulator of sigma subunit)
LTIPEDPSGVNPIELQAVLNRQDLWVESNTALSPDDPLRQAGRFAAIISHPVFLQNQLAGVLTVGRAAGGSAFNAGHVNIIHTFADFLGIQLRNVRIQEENVSSRLVTREVEIAATIQRSLLPEHLPEPPGFRLSGYSQSASGVGGDFYDAIQLEDGSLLMAMADVMGKGVPAAMFAAIFRSHVRARTDLASRPAEFMKWLNSTLYHDLDRVEMFVTAQLIHVDWQKRELKLAAAGHCPALLAVNGKEIWEIVAEGPPLGVDQSPFYDSTSFILPRNARLMMFTDGLVDARNESDGFFGMERVKRWFRESVEHQEPVRSASDRLIRQIADFRGDRSATDDITLLLLAEQRDIDD